MKAARSSLADHSLNGRGESTLPVFLVLVVFQTNLKLFNRLIGLNGLYAMTTEVVCSVLHMFLCSAQRREGLTDLAMRFRRIGRHCSWSCRQGIRRRCRRKVGLVRGRRRRRYECKCQDQRCQSQDTHDSVAQTK